jgi:hypothetical protein
MLSRFLSGRARAAAAVCAAIILVVVFQNCQSSQFAPLSAQLSSAAVTAAPAVTSLPATPAGLTLTENGASPVLASTDVDGVMAGQIFQRKDNGQAVIELKVKAALTSDLVYASVALLDAKGAVEKMLLSGVRNSTTGFAFELSTGLASRKVRLSLYDARGLEQRRWTSPGFSVGEVFLVAGQSNSSNHGEAPTASTSTLNRGVDPESKTWVPMADPLPYGTSWAFPQWHNQENPGGSAWPSFADDLSAKLQVPVAVISVGWGGSALSWWLPGAAENDFLRLVVGAKAVPYCGFRAVLWHQGESDSMAKFPASMYQTNFQTMVSAFRAATGCQQPWMIAQATWLHSKYWIQNYPSLTESTASITKWAAEMEIRRAQKNLSQTDNFLLGPDTDLVIAHKYRYDDLHFSSVGLPLHGKLWSQRVLKMLGRTYLQDRDLIPEVKTVWDAFQSALGRTAAEVDGDSEGVRYWSEKLSLGLVTAPQLIDSLRASDEAFIRQIYAENLNRRPTMDEVALWLAQLASGALANRTALKAAILAAK